MKGMDWTDQDLSYYSILRKIKKWTKKSVLYLINYAYHIHKKKLESKIVFKKFLLEVACEFLDATPEMDES